MLPLFVPCFNDEGRALELTLSGEVEAPKRGVRREFGGGERFLCGGLVCGPADKMNGGVHEVGVSRLFGREDSAEYIRGLMSLGPNLLEPVELGPPRALEPFLVRDKDIPR